MDPNALSSIGKFSRPLWPPVQDNNPPKDKKLRLLSSITMKKRRPATSIPPTEYPVRLHYCLVIVLLIKPRRKGPSNLPNTSPLPVVLVTPQRLVPL
ncbi:hypothetical protein DPEC_G00371100 [Dallia pectoralis]|nr:hypothetical protein DPEC_G00371100 [Dallia pectoralis]